VVVVAFDEFAVLEFGSGSDEGDEVGRVDGAPAALRGFDELVGHRDPGGAGAGPFSDPLPEPDGGEGGLDRIGGAQVDPVLGRVVIEPQQHVEVVGDLRGGFGPLGAVVGHERPGRGFGVVLVFGVPDLRQRSLRARVRRFR